MAGRIRAEGVELLSLNYPCGVKVEGQPADNGGYIMTQHKTSCCAAVFVSLCITFMPGGTNGCTGERYRRCSV